MASSFYYVAVKGALSSSDCDAFGLDPEEIVALTKRFPNSKAVVTNGVSIKGPPLTVINTLSQLGYKVVSSTGEIEITWTLQRETSACECPMPQPPHRRQPLHRSTLLQEFDA